MRLNMIFATLPVLLASFLLVACGGGQNVKPLACTWPDVPEKEAPGWICDEPVAGAEVTSVGSADKSKAGYSFTKNMAVADARVQLAQAMKTHVKNMIKQYVETTGAADSETVDKVNTSVSKLITNETLVGSKIFKSRTSPTGRLFVLVGLDRSAAQNAAKKAIKTSMKNDEALWQQFKAKKAQDELAAEISKISQ